MGCQMETSLWKGLLGFPERHPALLPLLKHLYLYHRFAYRNWPQEE